MFNFIAQGGEWQRIAFDLFKQLIVTHYVKRYTTLEPFDFIHIQVTTYSAFSAKPFITTHAAIPELATIN
jgi:hypothetical protein